MNPNSERFRAFNATEEIIQEPIWMMKSFFYIVAIALTNGPHFISDFPCLEELRILSQGSGGG